MNNKRIIKTTSAIALLLSLSLTACGTQDTQLLTATEESMQETATQETEANTETATDTESPLAQRDALEWEQRLDYSSERQAQLAEITVDLTQDVSCIIKIPIIAEGSPQSCRGNFPIIAEFCLVFS